MSANNWLKRAITKGAEGAGRAMVSAIPGSSEAVKSIFIAIVEEARRQGDDKDKPGIHSGEWAILRY